MATVIYRGPDGKTYTGQTGNGSLPPAVESMYTEKYLQPQANLQETQTAIGATGASAAHTAAETQLTQQQIAQKNLVQQAQTLFDKAANNNGKVAPDIYNKVKQQATGIGISGDEFDKQFEQAYTDPKNLDYNTSTAITGRTTRRAIDNFISTLEKHYQAAGGAASPIGPLSRVLGLGNDLGGAVGLNDNASLYNNQKNGFAATLKTLTGDTGVLTDQDFARLSKLLPDLGSTPGEATGSFNDLRGQIASKFGGQAGKTSIHPQGSTNILDMLLGSAMNTAKDVGTGAALNEVRPGLDTSENGALQMAQSATKRAATTKDPKEQARLNQVARDITQTIGTNEQGLSSSFSPDIQQSPMERGLKTGAEIATTAEIPGLVGGAKQLLTKGIPDTAKAVGGKILTQDAGSAMRNEAVKTAEEAGKTVDGSKLFSAIQDWADGAKRAEPASGKTIDKIVSSAASNLKDKALTPSETFQLWEDARKGFTAAGTKGNSLISSYHRAIRDSVRGELEQVAPGFEKGTQLIRQGLSRTDLLKNIGKQAGSTAVGVGASLAVLKLLKTLGIDQGQ